MKTMSKMSERVEWVDIAKGYGILLVIAAHMDISTLGVWIHTFHIPLFFFLSGYVFNGNVSFGIFLKKKVKGLIIPYFTLGIPLIIYDIIQKSVENYDIKEVICEDIGGFLLQRRMFTLWYIAALFFLNIIFFFITKYVKNLKVLAGISVLSVIAGGIYYKAGGSELVWNVDVCMMALPFFCFGYIFKNDSRLRERIFVKKYWNVRFFTMLVINLVCGLGTCAIGGEVLSMYGSTYGIIPLTYISAFAGIICVIMLSEKKSVGVLKYIGSNSLIYFAWHQSLIIPLIYDILEFFRIFTMGTTGGILLTKAVIFVVCIAVLTVLNEIVAKSRLKWIIGR